MSIESAQKNDENWKKVQGIKQMSGQALDAVEAGKFDVAGEIVSKIRAEEESESEFVKRSAQEHAKLVEDQIETEKKGRAGLI